MANKNKNTNELVADDEDPTAELEALTVRQVFGPGGDDIEADANTFDIENLDGEVREGVSVADLKSDLRMRSETIERLQFDIEQLHSKWLGLEAEIKSREELTSNLAADLKTAERKLDRKEAVLEKRDHTIKALKSDIRDRDKEFRELQVRTEQYQAEILELEAGDEISVARQQIVELQGLVSNQKALLHESEAQQQRTEKYADELRRRITDLSSEAENAIAESHILREVADDAEARMLVLEQEQQAAIESARQVSTALESTKAAHAEELRTLRFELVEAEQTIAESDKTTQGLAANLSALEQEQHSATARAEELAAALQDTEDSHAQEIRTLRIELDETQQSLLESRKINERLAADLNALEREQLASAEKADELEATLQKAEGTHAEELRTLRLELGEAQQALAESQRINEGLASDLIDVRNLREQLGQTLSSQQESSEQKIEELEKQLRNLNSTVVEYEYKLEKKTEAINSLLAELAKKSKEIDSIGEMEDVIQEIDIRMSERIDDRTRASAARTTRLLVGQIDDKELRFPLFKDRLTIGRTLQNDIQLDAQYISRRHAVIATEGDATRVIDWGSKNGVYVNSKRVTEHFLENGDIVTIGTAKFRYEERPKRDV